MLLEIEYFCVLHDESTITDEESSRLNVSENHNWESGYSSLQMGHRNMKNKDTARRNCTLSILI